MKNIRIAILIAFIFTDPRADPPVAGVDRLLMGAVKIGDRHQIGAVKVAKKIGVLLGNLEPVTDFHPGRGDQSGSA